MRFVHFEGQEDIQLFLVYPITMKMSDLLLDVLEKMGLSPETNNINTPPSSISNSNKGLPENQIKSSSGGYGLTYAGEFLDTTMSLFEFKFTHGDTIIVCSLPSVNDDDVVVGGLGDYHIGNKYFEVD